jgi:hypothetical protein
MVLPYQRLYHPQQRFHHHHTKVAEDIGIRLEMYRVFR